jgi:hypothetical protein
MQTIFPKPNLRYFPVNIPIVEINVNRDFKEIMDDVLQMAKANDEREYLRQSTIISSEVSRVERTPWLNRTGWLDMFNERDMKVLCECVSDKVEEGEDLKIIGLSVQRMIRKCLEGMADLESRGWGLIRFWLKSTDVGKASSKPFSLHYEDSTIRLRTSLWTKYLYFCMRGLHMETELGVRFTNAQSEYLSKIKRSISLNELTDEELDKQLLRASALLILHSDYEPQFSSLKYFLGVLGFNYNLGRWQHPNSYTPVLACIQFCIRIICTEYLLPTEMREDFHVTLDHTPLSVFKQFHQRWLVEGEATPFNYIYQLMNYGMAIAKNTKGDDKIRFSADKKRCYYRRYELDISIWRAMPKDILRTAEMILSRQLLFQTSDTITPVNPYSIVDYEGITDVGHFFGDTIPDYRHIARSTILDNLHISKMFDSMATIDGHEITWRKNGIRKYATDQDEFLELILMTINLTCGQTGRGAEMLSIIYKNVAAADRNVIVLDGQIMISTEYHKSQAITDDIKVQIGFYVFC